MVVLQEYTFSSHTAYYSAFLSERITKQNSMQIQCY